MNFMDVVSKRIVELREEKGETQQELANAIGITRQTLSRYEIAARTVNVDVLAALAQHFKVSADYLLGLSDIRSTVQNMQTACEVTGLSEKAIENIKSLEYRMPDKIRKKNMNFIEKNKIEQTEIAHHLYEEIKETFYYSINEKDKTIMQITNTLFESKYFDKIIRTIVAACLKRVESDEHIDSLKKIESETNQEEKKDARDALILAEEFSEEQRNIDNSYKVAIMDVYAFAKEFVEFYAKQKREGESDGKHHGTQE